MRRYIDNAIRTGKTVTIKYIKFEGEYSVRQISDIQYSSEFGDDYIDAFCHKRQERRTFRLSINQRLHSPRRKRLLILEVLHHH